MKKLKSLLSTLNSNLSPKHGFTLIELLIVIAIIGILAALMMTNLAGARQRARDVRRKADLDSISKSLRLYYNDKQSFPISSGTSISCSGSDSCAWGGPFKVGLTTYMNYLPTDPSSTSSSTIYYKYWSDGIDGFAITTELENASDPTISTQKTACNYASLPSALKSTSGNDYVVCVQ